MSGWLKKRGLALCASAAGLLLVPGLAQADSLIDNVNGMTLDSKGKVIRFTGMVIDDEGRVKQLLDRRDKRPREMDFQFDGKGQNLVPGFFDAHGHWRPDPRSVRDQIACRGAGKDRAICSG